MRYLVKLTSMPKNGVVLDPFMGSGSTIVACVLEGQSAIGIELEEASYITAEARLKVTLKDYVAGGDRRSAVMNMEAKSVQENDVIEDEFEVLDMFE